MNKLEQAARQIIDAWNHGSPFEKYLVALDEALAEPQITTPDVCGEVCARAKLCYGCNKDLEEANAKYAEQAEQELSHKLDTAIVEATNLEQRIDVALEMVKQEPAAWAKFTKDCIAVSDDQFEGAKPLYAAPVRTKDLTNAEIWEIVDNTKPTPLDFARAVIAADREKNE